MIWLKRLGWFLLGFAGIAALLYLVGLFIPREHKFSESILLPQPPPVVWSRISDIGATPAWRTGLARIEPLPPRGGKPAWFASGDFGELVYVIEESLPPRKLVSRVEESKDFSGAWTFTLEASGNGTLLTITEEGEIYNPVFRAMLKLVYGYGISIRLYFQDLERVLGAPSETVPPDPQPAIEAVPAKNH
ncbi:MAG: SRPBCC family protein [Acidobacteriota bacterium]|nr:SRPBCC family protein [Acidobacteriota bacterium]